MQASSLDLRFLVWDKLKFWYRRLYKARSELARFISDLCGSKTGLYRE